MKLIGRRPGRLAVMTGVWAVGWLEGKTGGNGAGFT